MHSREPRLAGIKLLSPPSLFVSFQTDFSSLSLSLMKSAVANIVSFFVVVCSLGFVLKKKIKRNRGVKRASSLIFAVESVLDEDVKKKNKKIIIPKQ